MASRRLFAAAALAAAVLLLLAAAAGGRTGRAVPRCSGIVSWLGPVQVKDGRIVGKPPKPVSRCER
jgi:hypothetical protein